MNRRSRLLRVAKWGGVVVCVLFLTIWVIQYVRSAIGPRPLRRGDRIVSIDGKNIRSFADIIQASSKNKAVAVTLVDAAGTVHSTQLVPRSPRGAFSFLADLPHGTVLLVAVPTAVLFRFDRRLVPGHCPCGYDLHGNVSGRCPECGRAAVVEGDHARGGDAD